MGFCTKPQCRFVLLWSILSYFLCVTATRRCNFMRINGYLIPDFPYYKLQDQGFDPTSSMIGPFGYEDRTFWYRSESCASYSAQQLDNFLDGPWKAARICAILANILLGVTLINMIIATCVSYNPVVLKILAAMSLAGSVCIMLTFLMFASKVSDEPHNGRFYAGGGIAIVSFLCAVATGLLILHMGPPAACVNDSTISPTDTTTPGIATSGNNTEIPPQPHQNSPVQTSTTDKPVEDAPTNTYDPGTETVTETVLPDGSRKIVTTRVGLDGSMFVTEMILEQS